MPNVQGSVGNEKNLKSITVSYDALSNKLKKLFMTEFQRQELTIL